MHSATLICLVACVLAPCAAQMAGRGVRRDGLLVADTTPFVGNPAEMAQCPNSCSNHGVCVIQDGGVFPPSCTCLYMWSGPDCSIAQCPNNCSDVGVCNHTNGYCACQEGRGLADCSLNLRLNQCPNDCSSNGICQSGKCACFQAWEGMDCSLARCPGNCSFHGVCVDLDPSFGGSKCTCNEGWAGPACSTPIRECPGRHAPCSSHGTCDHSVGVCTCEKGHTGADCSQRDCVTGYLSRDDRHAPPWTSNGCPNDCSCHGYCICDSHDDQDSCFCGCEPGWGGDACSMAIPTHVPFDGINQPYPDVETYPHLHPYLTDAERAAIALKRKTLQLPDPVEDTLLVQQAK